MVPDLQMKQEDSIRDMPWLHMTRSSQPDPYHRTSAQEAELKALKLACQEATEKVVNIYTDSRSSFGVARDFGSIWTARGYPTSSGTPLKHAATIQELVVTLDLPSKVAVIEIKAHGRLDFPEAKGNFFADKTAKTYAVDPFRKEKAAVYVSQDTEEGTKASLMRIIHLHQGKTSDDEKKSWQEGGAKKDEDGVWKVNKKLCLPRNLYPSVTEWAHGITHRGKNQMNDLIWKTYMAPGISTITQKLFQVLPCVCNMQSSTASESYSETFD
ncbi:uncharacterized protein LOC143808172 [Ranitomeya variabilis]|uniref:uncharacterized protein LOC143808172 n=1 Tax=Ranitomeya variabilis TaxID=490064 RepID=UPI004056726A